MNIIIGLEQEIKDYKGPGDVMDYSDLEFQERENQEGGSETPGMITKDRRGPYHSILKIAYHCRIHDILNCNDDAILQVYATKILPFAVGKQKWNTCSKMVDYYRFVTTSDEAFAMILLENGATRWLDKLKEPTKRRKDLEHTRYTQGDILTNKAPGWSHEGIERYVMLMGDVSRNQKNTDFKKRLSNLVVQAFQKKDERKLRARERLALEKMRNNGILNYNDQRNNEQGSRKKQKVENYLLDMTSKSFDPSIVQL